MRKIVLSLVVLVGLLAVGSRAQAGVNCDQVRRYLSTGRTVDDVAETMIISVDDVKKCQQAGGDQKAAATPAAGAKQADH